MDVPPLPGDHPLLSAEATEGMLLNWPLLRAEELLAVAGRPGISAAVRARVARVALTWHQHDSAAGPAVLAAAVRLPDWTPPELVELAGQLHAQARDRPGPALAALAAHRACTDEALAAGLADVRTYLPLGEPGARIWRAALAAVAEVDPDVALAARAVGYRRCRDSTELLAALGLVRELTAVGRTVAGALVEAAAAAGGPPVPVQELLRAAGAVATPVPAPRVAAGR